jgi:hypothetical protein
MEEYHGGTPAGLFRCPLCRQPLVVPLPWGGSYELPGMDPIGFRTYVEWLYSGPSPNDLNSDTTRRAYIVGEKLEDEDFCRYLLSAFAMT